MGTLAKAVALVAACAGSAHADAGVSLAAINVSFGPPGNAPPATYAAAGRAGVWNRVAGQAGTTYPLVGIYGEATNVTLSQSPSTTLLAGTDPSVTGDDAKLMENAL